jgi:hypothetical protein
MPHHSQEKKEDGYGVGKVMENDVTVSGFKLEPWVVELSRG